MHVSNSKQSRQLLMRRALYIRQGQQFVLLSRQPRQGQTEFFLPVFQCQWPRAISRSPCHESADADPLHAKDLIGCFRFGSERIQWVEEVIHCVDAGEAESSKKYRVDE